jgi:hypothetical protein
LGRKSNPVYTFLLKHQRVEEWKSIQTDFQTPEVSFCFSVCFSNAVFCGSIGFIIHENPPAKTGLFN